MHEFEELWYGLMERYQGLIQRKRVSIYAAVHDCSFDFLSTQKIEKRTCREVGQKGAVELAKNDRKILAVLAAEARLPTVEIAERTGISVSAVRTGIRRLIESGVIKGFRTRIDAAKLGLTHYKVDFQLRDLSRYKEMVDFALADPRIIYIDRSIGYADLEVEVLVANFPELQESIKRIAGEFAEHIREYDYFIINKIYKIKYFSG